MRAEEIRKLSIEELNAKVETFKIELFELRMKKAVGELENPAKLKEVRKTIARIKTIIKQKEMER